jgi:hypothetical protein
MMKRGLAAIVLFVLSAGAGWSREEKKPADERPGARTLVGLNRNLLDNLQRLNLNVERIVPIHGQKVMTFAEFRKAVETNP